MIGDRAAALKGQIHGAVLEELNSRTTAVLRRLGTEEVRLLITKQVTGIQNHQGRKKLIYSGQLAQSTAFAIVKSPNEFLGIQLPMVQYGVFPDQTAGQNSPTSGQFARPLRSYLTPLEEGGKFWPSPQRRFESDDDLDENSMEGGRFKKKRAKKGEPSLGLSRRVGRLPKFVEKEDPDRPQAVGSQALQSKSKRIVIRNKAAIRVAMWAIKKFSLSTEDPEQGRDILNIIGKIAQRGTNPTHFLRNWKNDPQYTEIYTRTMNDLGFEISDWLSQVVKEITPGSPPPVPKRSAKALEPQVQPREGVNAIDAIPAALVINVKEEPADAKKRARSRAVTRETDSRGITRYYDDGGSLLAFTEPGAARRAAKAKAKRTAAKRKATIARNKNRDVV